MRIRNSITSLRIQNNALNVENKLNKSIKKLASGLRINSAADDAAGLKISERMRSQIRGLEQASLNIQDAMSLIQTAESGYGNISNLLQRMNELTIKAGNGILTESDKETIYQEICGCVSEIDRIATVTSFNGKKLLSKNMNEIEYNMLRRVTGSGKVRAAEIGKIDLSTVTDSNVFVIQNDDKEYRFEFDSDGVSKELESVVIDIKGAITNEEKVKRIKDAITSNTGLQVVISGSDENEKFIQINSKQKKKGEEIKLSTCTYADIFKTGNELDDKIAVSFKAMDTLSLGVRNLRLNTQDDINKSLDSISNALTHVTTQWAEMGALQNRLEYNLNRVEIQQLNTEGAKSRITDVDIAKEIVQQTKNKILNQSVTSMMAQANKNNAQVLNLIK